MSSVLQGSYGRDLGSSLSSPATTPVETGDTCGKVNDFAPSCDLSSAPDMAYIWTAPFTDTFTFSTEGSVLDTILEIRPYNNTTQSLGCNDQGFPSGNASKVTVALTQGTTVYVIVDGYARNCGPYRLLINGSCPGGCNTPPSACHVAQGTCNSGTCSYALKAAGTACDDGKSCTMNDVCNASGTCGGTLSCTPPNQCMQLAQNACANGSCTFEPKPAGAACNDGNACTVNDVCNGAGSCGGAPMQCTNTQGQCYQAQCEAGTCVTRPKPSGTSCNDGLACTRAEKCNGSGVCRDLTTCRPTNGCTFWTGTCTGDVCDTEYACGPDEVCSQQNSCEPINP